MNLSGDHVSELRNGKRIVYGADDLFSVCFGNPTGMGVETVLTWPGLEGIDVAADQGAQWLQHGPRAPRS